MSFSSYFTGMYFGNSPIIFEDLYFIDENAGQVGVHNLYINILYHFGIPFLLFLFYYSSRFLKDFLQIDNYFLIFLLRKEFSF